MYAVYRWLATGRGGGLLIPQDPTDGSSLVGKRQLHYYTICIAHYGFHTWQIRSLSAYLPCTSREDESHMHGGGGPTRLKEGTWKAPSSLPHRHSGIEGWATDTNYGFACARLDSGGDLCIAWRGERGVILPRCLSSSSSSSNTTALRLPPTPPSLSLSLSLSLSPSPSPSPSRSWAFRLEKTRQWGKTTGAELHYYT
ncbi:hypothetical protein LZ30DRAFT_360979 [Colletotrichum cereale]|nr:hypothetical protein LZ30DRAFT_360979 [Colletotrichum cereale]